MRLTDTFRGTPDAARGPLRGGELGIVLTEDDDWSGRPYKVTTLTVYVFWVLMILPHVLFIPMHIPTNNTIH